VVNKDWQSVEQVTGDQQQGEDEWTHNQEGDQAFYSGEGSSFNVAIMKVLMQLE
jgi:hypothetical protein